MDTDIKPRWTLVEYVTSTNGERIKGAITGKPERNCEEKTFAACVTDTHGEKHYFSVAESECKVVIKQFQELVGEGE